MFQSLAWVCTVGAALIAYLDNAPLWAAAACIDAARAIAVSLTHERLFSPRFLFALGVLRTLLLLRWWGEAIPAFPLLLELGSLLAAHWTPAFVVPPELALPPPSEEPEPLVEPETSVWFRMPLTPTEEFRFRSDYP